MEDIRATRLETDDDMRRALEHYRPPHGGQPATANGAPVVRENPVVKDCPPPFRPTRRPATPVLIVCDDGADEGEIIRIRKDHFVIGRTEGDLIIPHDVGISGRHLELRRTIVEEKPRWTLIDLGSTNGTFVRVGEALLDDGQELIIGSTHLRFEKAAPAEPAPQDPPSDGLRGTLVLSAAAGRDRSAPAHLVVGEETRFPLEGAEVWLGRDAAHCRVALNDPYVNVRHARFRPQPDGRWTVENNKSVNGVWLRVKQTSFQGACSFMLGEQKFKFRTP